MLYQYGKRTRDFFEAFLFFFKFSLLYFWGVFNETITQLALVGYDMIIANSALCVSLAIYHLISNARLWNNCEIFLNVALKRRMPLCCLSKNNNTSVGIAFRPRFPLLTFHLLQPGSVLFFYHPGSLPHHCSCDEKKIPREPSHWRLTVVDPD